MRKVRTTLIFAVAFFASKGRADKPLPTAGPVYSYYAPHPTTTTAAPAPTTANLPPLPPAPYDAYYDSLYHSPYESQQQVLA